ncbi:MAG: histidine phosphatase family protein [Pseudomonadota bacterium]
MTQTTRWWWVRHAPAVGHDGRVYGSTIDVPVDTSDPTPYRALAAALPSNAVLLTSPLHRTMQTADAISAQGFAPVARQVEESLQELSFGDWQGMTYAELRKVSGGHPVWFTPPAVVPPNGESFLQMCERVVPTVERLTEAFAGRDIVSVSHGGPIRAAIGLALGCEMAQAVYFHINNLSLTRLEYAHPSQPGAEGGKWRVRCINLRPNQLKPV